MEYNENEKMSLAVAGGVIVFSVIAIIAYVYTGGGVLFYAIAIITLCLEFYMAFRISRENNAQDKEPKKQQRRNAKK